MSHSLAKTPNLPRAPSRGTVFEAFKGLGSLTTALVRVLSEMSFQINEKLSRDGHQAMTGPLPLVIYTVATLPAATTYTGNIVFVSDETGGAVPAFSDGTNWRRVQDRAIVS